MAAINQEFSREYAGVRQHQPAESDHYVMSVSLSPRLIHFF